MSDEKEKAEIRLMDAEIAKLEAETANHERQSSKSARRWEKLRALTGLTGIITAFIAVVGVILSIAEFQREDARAREVQTVKQLNDSILLLADQNKAKKLAGVASLESFFHSGHKTDDPQIQATQKQILTLFFNMLTIEEDKNIRDAILVTLRNLDLENLDDFVKESALKQLVGMSRSLVSEGHLREVNLDISLENLRAEYEEMKTSYNNETVVLEESAKRLQKFDLEEVQAEIEDIQIKLLAQNNVVPRAKSISEAISAFVRAYTYTDDFSGIYCTRCDFSDLDLNEVDFSDAMLASADFTKARLALAKFDGADLHDTSFKSATLTGANFRFTPRPKQGKYRRSYIRNRVNQYHVSGPTFDCANLQNADFSGHPIFGFNSIDRSTYTLTTASFIGADINGTLFSDSEMYIKTLTSKDFQGHLTFPFDYTSASSSITTDPETSKVVAHGIANFGPSLDHFTAEKTTPYDMERFARSLSGTNWKTAKFPLQMEHWLKENHPSRYMEFIFEEDICDPPDSRKAENVKIAFRVRRSLKKTEIESAFVRNDVQFLTDALVWKANTDYGLQGPYDNFKSDIFEIARFRELLYSTTPEAREAGFASLIFSHIHSTLKQVDAPTISNILSPFDAIDIDELYDNETDKSTAALFQEALKPHGTSMKTMLNELIAERETLDIALLTYFRTHEKKIVEYLETQ